MREFLDDYIRAPGFLQRYPYYAAVLARIEPVADPSVRYIALSLYGGRYYLHINSDYFVAHPEHLRGLLLHEVHHLVLGHLSREEFRGAAAPRLMELALEISANEYIEEALPEPRIEWQLFKRQGLRAGQSTLTRYQLLTQAPAQGVEPQGTVDDHHLWQARPPSPGATEQTRQLIVAALADAPPEAPGHALLAGRSPGRLLEELTGVTRPPEIYLDWKTALAMFVARARAPVHTYARPNRRFPDRVGGVPGRTYSPRVINRPHLLVALDTSLSMSRDELAEVARQLTVLAERARLTIAECDTQVHRTYGFAGALPAVSGRGGTDLRPVFAAELLAGVRPDGVIYFTDGNGPFDPSPPGLPVLWVLTKPAEFPCPWGARARLCR